MGSKSRIAKHIVPIIQKYINDNDVKNYCEPFVGGANIIDKIVVQNKCGSDIQEYLIEVYKHLYEVQRQLPNIVTKEHYSDVRDCYNNKSDKYPKWYVGAIGFLASYNGRFFDGGYAGVVHTKAGTVRDYYNEARRNLYRQIPNLENIKWVYADYKNIKPNLCHWVLYCDIPYKDTKQYNSSKNFNHEEYWEWARNMSKNNFVITSEHQAPDDFECIWEQPILRTVDNTKRVKTIERLFKYKSQ